jgi:hypothetical protein
LQLAAWSSDDDRLPGAPPVENRGVGTIDARVLTEGAIHAALRDAIAGAGGGDSVSVMARALGDRQLVQALVRATAQGAHLQLLLDPGLPANQAVAAELLRTAAGSIDVRWAARGAGTHACFVLIQHRNDVWLNLGSAEFTRRALDDLNLETNIELHMPARAPPARAAAESFARAFASGTAYADHADERRSLYWRYRLAEATGFRVL